MTPRNRGRRRRLAGSVLGVVVSAAGFGVATASTEPATARIDPASVRPAKQGPITRVSERGLFRVTTASLLDPIRINTLHSWTLHLATAAATPVNGARILVEVVWPHSGGPMQTTPRVRGLGSGNYLIEGIKLQMKDFWRVSYRIFAAGKRDSVTYDLLVQDVPGSSDLSAVKLSSAGVAKPKRGLFLGYPFYGFSGIAINELHDWTLQVVTLDGKPVERARITIDGDMPAHGHGLPTKPRVTKEIGNGFYLIQGMKFQMPGKWHVNFFVNAAGRRDELVYDFVIR